MKKTARNYAVWQKSHQKNKHLDIPPCKIHRTILNWDKGGTQTNRQKDKRVDNYA